MKDFIVKSFVTMDEEMSGKLEMSPNDILVKDFPRYDLSQRVEFLEENRKAGVPGPIVKKRKEEQRKRFLEECRQKREEFDRRLKNVHSGRLVTIEFPSNFKIAEEA